MSRRKGRQASLPLGEHTRPPVLEPGELVVWHVEEDGARKEFYDFGALSVAPTLQRELAEHFAARVGPEGAWRTLPTSAEVWYKLMTFATWLSKLETSPRALAELTPVMWMEWRLSRSTSTTGKREITKLAAFLRDHPAVSEETREVLFRRVPIARGAKEVAYNQEEFDRVKGMATRVFRAALLRIRENRQWLEDWRAGRLERGTVEWGRGESLDHVARTGDIPTYISFGQFGDGWRVRTESRHQVRLRAGSTWQRLFLTSEEAASLVLLLIATYGWNAVPASEVRVPKATPNPGVDGPVVYRVELEKRRRGGAKQHETRNLADWGANSPGRLISQAIEATAPARELLAAEGTPVDRLIVWHLNRTRDPEKPVSDVFRVGIDDHGWRNLQLLWRRNRGWNTTINLRRLRKTVVVLHQRTPIQHSQYTHDQTYVLPDPQSFERSTPVISAGIESALEHARTVFTAHTSRDDTPAEQDTVTAGCGDYTHSPFSEHGAPCRASFLLCTACPNGVVTPRHLPRLAYLHRALDDLRGVVPAAVWDRDWREHHARLLDLKTRPDFTDAEWRDALDAVTAHDKATIDLLLRNGYDA
jgi:hypothetical protein